MLLPSDVARLVLGKCRSRRAGGRTGVEGTERPEAGGTVAWGGEALRGRPLGSEFSPAEVPGPSEARVAWMPLLELSGEGAAGERSSAWNTWGLDSEAEPGPLGPLEEGRSPT